MNSEDCKNYLYASEVDVNELEWVIGHYFGSGRYDGNDAVFHRAEPDGELRLKFSRKGNLTRIETTGSISRKDLRLLRETIKSTLIDNQVSKVRRVIALSRREVKGFFRCDHFQIMPIPEGSPTLPYQDVDKPFILEVPFVACSNWMLNDVRWRAASEHTGRLLSLFIDPHLKLNDHSNCSWTIGMVEGGASTTEWRQLGYDSPVKVEKEQDGFTDTLDLPLIPVEEPKRFYSWFGPKVTEEMTLPDNLDSILQAATELKGDAASRFSRATTWFWKSGSLGQILASSGYIALVSAIESLLPDDKETCACCKQDKYGLTGKFRSFLQEFAPTFPELQDAPKELNAIYGEYYVRRSKLVHGADILVHDLDDSWNFHHHKAQDIKEASKLFITVRMALCNWLLAQGQASDASTAASEAVLEPREVQYI